MSWEVAGKAVGKAPKKGGECFENSEENHLPVPHCIKILGDVIKIATGPASAHNFAITRFGDIFAWGRNNFGQLGLGNTATVYSPIKIESLCSPEDPIVDMACGRNHSLFATKSGKLFSCGGNDYGQLGIGVAGEFVNTPTLVEITGTSSKMITSVKAGIDFSVILTDAGEVLTFGSPEFGKLGNNTNGEYNTKASSVKMAYTPFPTPQIVAALGGVKIRLIAAGNHHSLAASDSNVFAWGSGSLGRLGGGPTENKDKCIPTKCASNIWERMSTKSFRLLIAGAQTSAAVLGDGMMYLWGRVRPSEEANMYPKPVYDLQGWNIRTIAMGTNTVLVGAEKSCVAWGQTQTSELGFGFKPAPKSSSKPKKN